MIMKEDITMKKQEHLPVYGVGPFCVYTMVLILIIAITLDHFNYLDQGKVASLKIPMFIGGCILILIGICIWIKAVLIDKIGDNILKNHLLTSGIYAYVRNPIYSAALIALSGIALLFNNLYFLILPFIFWAFISVLMKHSEEKWLLKQYGQEYRDYCAKVNRCIPWFPKK